MNINYWHKSSLPVMFKKLELKVLKWKKAFIAGDLQQFLSKQQEALFTYL